jgi:hypothetical protein
MVPRPQRTSSEYHAASGAGLRGYTRDALSILEASLHLFHQGQRLFYRVTALELRLLLCDTTRQHSRLVDVSLAARLWPDLRLHALRPTDGDLVFESGPPSLSRPTWLAQPLAVDSGRQTIRGLIRLVCDRDGGAHVDPRDSSPIPIQAPGWIATIGEYILGQLSPLLRE